jgi:hypothetical protein
MKLLRGLKYNIHYEDKNWMKIQAVEADTAISQLNETDQIYMNEIVANNLQKIINKDMTQKEGRTALKRNPKYKRGNLSP